MQAGTRVGPYEILGPLGAGGMGEVWRARDTRLDRAVALKVLPQDFFEDEGRRGRFEREAKLLAALSHPNIAVVYAFEEISGSAGSSRRHLLAMELLEGETLRGLLAGGSVPVRRALEIAEQVAQGLAAAHEKGIVHRDIKPENVFVTKDGHVKVLDFGLARSGAVPAGRDETESPTVEKLTSGGAVVGTVAYMSPEQARGLALDHRSDQFSLGIVLYEMLAGRRPFKGESVAETLTAIIREEPEPLSNQVPPIPAPVRWIVERCLVKDGSGRYDTTRDLARDLRTLSLHVSEAGSATGSALAPGARPRRNRTALVASVIGVAAAGLAGAFWLGHVTDRPARSRTGPVPQLVRLTWEPGVEAYPNISPDGSSFVYQAGPDGHRDIFLRRVRGENPVNLTKDFPGDNYMPAFSPDGRSIAFRSEREGGGIFVMGATGESPRRLSDFGYEPAWSPDGKAIAVGGRGSRGGGLVDGLWVIEVATGAKRKLHERDARRPSWSPSGTRIAFHQRKAALVSFTLSTIPVSGGAPTKVLDLPTSLPSMPFWTREGIWFLSSGGGVPNVWRVRVDEATGMRIGEAEPILNGPGSSFPSGTADGRRLLFTMGSRTTTIDRYDFDTAHGKLIPEPHAVLTGPRDLRLAAVSPNGGWLATVFFDDPGKQDIVLVRVSTGETRRLTDDTLREDFLEWAPDGSKLYFVVSPEGTNEVWSIRPDGSGREREVVAEGKQELKWTLASPDGRWLAVEVGADSQSCMVDLRLPLSQRKLVPLPPLPSGKVFVKEDWSPDGRWLVGIPRTAAQGPEPRLYLFDTERKTFEDLVDVKLGWPGYLGWFPDSRRLLHRVGEKLEVIDRVTRTLTPAGSLGIDVQRAYLSRDGRSLFGFRWVVESDIWMLDYGTAR